MMLCSTLCSKCGRRALIRLAYASLDLCARCFLRQFERRIRRNIRQNKLITHNERVGVAISGGKDSASLLHYLATNARAHRIEVVPLLVDEGIAGYRALAIKKAKALCRRHGLHLKITSFKRLFGATLDDLIARRDALHKEAQSRGKNDKSTAFVSACSYCGALRRTALNRAARELGCDKLALGHNLDDVVQTFLMNLAHNVSDALQRFDLISAHCNGFVPRIRPLALNTERECALYATLQELPFHLGECPYAGESFRVELRRHINDLEARWPGTKHALFASWLNLKKAINGATKRDERVVICSSCNEPAATSPCKACVLLKGLGLS